MARRVVLTCDRCGADNVKNLTKMEGFLLPSGHYSRLDAVERKDVEICDKCRVSLNCWWLRQPEPELTEKAR